MEQQQQGDTPPFWLENSSQTTNHIVRHQQQQQQQRRRNPRRAAISSSFLLNPWFLIPTTILSLFFISYLISLLSSFAPLSFRRSPSNRTWETISPFLIFFAIIAGILSRKSNPSSSSSSSLATSTPIHPDGERFAANFFEDFSGKLTDRSSSGYVGEYQEEVQFVDREKTHFEISRIPVPGLKGELFSGENGGRDELGVARNRRSSYSLEDGRDNHPPLKIINVDSSSDDHLHRQKVLPEAPPPEEGTLKRRSRRKSREDLVMDKDKEKLISRESFPVVEDRKRREKEKEKEKKSKTATTYAAIPTPPPLPSPRLDEWFASQTHEAKTEKKRSHSHSDKPPPVPPPAPQAFNSNRKEPTPPKRKEKSKRDEIGNGDRHPPNLLPPLPSSTPQSSKEKERNESSKKASNREKESNKNQGTAIALPYPQLMKEKDQFDKSTTSSTSSSGYGIPLPPPPPPPPQFVSIGRTYSMDRKYVKNQSHEKTSHAIGEGRNDKVVSGEVKTKVNGKGNADVDLDADRFIAQFRAGIRLEKLHSIRERQEKKGGKTKEKT